MILKFFIIILLIQLTTIILFLNIKGSFKWKIFSRFFLPVHNKISTKKTDKEIRGMIHGYLIANPGSDYNTIKTRLKKSDLSITNNLQDLIKSRKVVEINSGLESKFYPTTKTNFNQFKLSKDQRKIIKVVREHKNPTEAIISNYTNMPIEEVRENLLDLTNEGLLVTKNEGEENYFSLFKESNKYKFLVRCTKCNESFHTYNKPKYCPYCKFQID